MSDFNHDKTIKKLDKKAKDGNFYSAIELSNYYNLVNTYDIYFAYSSKFLPSIF